MIVDFAAAPVTGTIQTDIAIIGSGPAGLSLAAKLNRDCCVIESGGVGLDIANHWRFRSVNAGERTNVDSLRVRGIGGASLRWTGRCIPLDRYDFEDRPWIAPSPWPIAYDELAPWFDRAADLMELQPVTAPQRHASPDLDAAIAKDGRWQSAIWRFADHKERGMLRFGDYLADAFTTKQRNLIYNAHCTKVLGNEKAVKALVVSGHDGRETLVRANHFVVAAGCVENSRLLLAARRENPALLSSVETWLGRGFNQHLRVDAGELAMSAPYIRPLQKHMTLYQRRGVTLWERGFGLDPDFARAQRIGNASLVLRYQSQSDLDPRNLVARAGGRLLGRPVAFSNPKALVEIDTEQTVDAASRIELDEEPDALGMPRARVHWTISETDCQTAYDAAQVFANFASEQGLGTVTLAQGLERGTIDPAIRRDANHQLGGTRMSDTAQTGVVDPTLTVHGVENLSIVGGSVFSTGGHANPTQTIVALALRLAERLNASTR
ncbi:MAG: GMC oxidoreductase [Pseudomonadota bacterium]